MPTYIIIKNLLSNVDATAIIKSNFGMNLADIIILIHV